MEAPTSRKPICLRMLFKDYIQVLDNEVRIIRNQNPGLTVKRATILAIRRAGGHVLKEAKRLRHLFERYVHFQRSLTAEDHRLASMSHWATESKEYRKWQFLVEYVEQRKIEQEDGQCHMALVRRSSCANIEGISIGVWIRAIIGSV